MSNEQDRRSRTSVRHSRAPRGGPVSGGPPRSADNPRRSAIIHEQKRGAIVEEPQGTKAAEDPRRERESPDATIRRRPPAPADPNKPGKQGWSATGAQRRLVASEERATRARDPRRDSTQPTPADANTPFAKLPPANDAEAQPIERPVRTGRRSDAPRRERAAGRNANHPVRAPGPNPSDAGRAHSRSPNEPAAAQARGPNAPARSLAQDPTEHPRSPAHPSNEHPRSLAHAANDGARTLAGGAAELVGAQVRHSSAQSLVGSGAPPRAAAAADGGGPTHTIPGRRFPSEAREPRGAEQASEPAKRSVYCEIDGLAVVIDSADLTPAGLFVPSPSPAATDTEVRVYLSAGTLQLEATGHVVQSFSLAEARKARRKAGYGLLFTQISDAARTALREMIEGLQAQPAAPPLTSYAPPKPNEPARTAPNAPAQPAAPPPLAPTVASRSGPAQTAPAASSRAASTPAAPSRAAPAPAAASRAASTPAAASRAAPAPAAASRAASTPAAASRAASTPAAPSRADPAPAASSRAASTPAAASRAASTPAAPSRAAPAPAAASRADPAPPAPAIDPQEVEMLARLRAELAALERQPPWTVLGISQGAEEEAAREAFFTASKRYHPHLYARHALSEIKEVVTQIFILYKRAFTTMTKTARAGRAAGSGKPPGRSSEPGHR